MSALARLGIRLLEGLLVGLLGLMVVLVFGNVVLRYGFNSGITISDEMSRYCFIWLTYIGAMIAMREKGHLGVDTLVKHLPVGGKKACLFLSESLMLILCMGFQGLLDGLLRQQCWWPLPPFLVGAKPCWLRQRLPL